MGVPGSANFLLAGSQGYRIERSLRFNSADSAYLNRTPAGSGTGAGRTWTWSGWVKRGKSTPSDLQLLLSASSSRSGFGFFTSSGGGTGSDSFSIYHGASFATRVETTQVFRDFSSWYHIVVSVDTTQATAANRIRIYVNGSEVTQFSTASYPAQNYQFGICEATAHAIGRDASAAAYYFDGYLTESYLIDGQALTPSSFGETDTITGVWKPKKYAGTYGTNGFYLNFSDNSGTTSTTLGKDSSGNSNNWTPNNFSVTAGAGNDSLIDTPTPYADGGNGRGNYATMNPLACGVTLTNGNLELTTATNYASSTLLGTSTLEMATGSWYWEAAKTSGTSTILWIGIVSAATATISSSIFVYGSDGTYYQSGSTVATGKATYATNDVIGIALNSNTKSIEFYKNGVSQGSYTVSFSGPYYVTAYDGDSGASCTFSFSFGQRSFAYTPPSGFVALNTQNLPEPSIKKPSSYFDATLYTGNGSTQTISGLGFSPDLVWIKSRSAATNNDVFDSVRGATVGFATNSTQPESTFSGVTAFNSNGFSLGSNTSDNANAATYVAWCWDESATPGFDIVTYTGNATNRTIAHSLGVAPSMMILKNRSSAGNGWPVYHQSANASPATGGLRLNLTDAFVTYSPYWNNTAPTSSVFTVGTDSQVNGNTHGMVAYLWSEVAGFSKFGSFTGNNSSDGPFAFCGFRPKYVLIKDSTNGSTGWLVFDASRDTYNVAGAFLDPSSSSAESGSGNLDFLSNGFKIRVNGSSAPSLNQSGARLVFAAFAEAPFKYALAR
jgi:hypothetical protein